jgi:hypothetical protein
MTWKAGSGYGSGNKLSRCTKPVQAMAPYLQNKKTAQSFITLSYTVIRFLGVNDKFSTCTVVRVNGTLVEDKMRRFKGECEHFRFNKSPIYIHDGESAKFSTNSQEMDNSVENKRID